MCGLAGFINFENNKVLAQRANAAQKHRGPDHQGIWSDDHLAFAHQRLSIIDLTDRGNQPFHKDNFVIIFNGEIYNYKELQANLLKIQGVEFKSDSDTEVILEYYRHYKEKCLSFFIGMFAFAIYDTNKKELFIARDHFGIKPLFYTNIDGKFAFASELKTLISTPGFDLTINYKSLISSLNYLWVSGDESIFNNCYKLPPAHFIRISENMQIDINRYWSIEGTMLRKPEDKIKEELSAVILKSLQRHMVADVPVSTFLSGGLDSSLISVLASNYNKGLSTYTIGVHEKDKQIEQMPDDHKYARSLAELHKFDHHEITISADILKLLPQIVRTLDEPIGDPAAINTFLICEAAKSNGVKVLLSGMGADEFFAGYRRHRAALMAEKYQRIPLPVRQVISRVVELLPVKIGQKGIRLTRWAKRFLSFACLPAEKAYMSSYSYYSREELQSLLNKDFKQELDSLYKEHEEIFSSKYSHDRINQMCNTDMYMFLLGLNLTYTDRASMAASVEVRVPFVDKEVANFAMNVPGKFKIKNGESKYILKKVAEKYLPKKIIYRPKAAFGAPIRSWISNELRPLVDDLLSQATIEKRGIFNHKFVKELIDQDRSGISDNAYRIYQLITVELWFREFIDKKIEYETSNTELQNRQTIC